MSLTKAINTRANSSAALKNTLDYIYKEGKVNEGLKLVIGDYFQPEVTPDLVYQHFMDTKNFWHKPDGRMYKHFVISFHKDEKITPEETLMFGKEWAEKCFPGFDCALASHIDADHCHVHVVVNSVNSVTGRKINLSNHQFQKMKDINDQLCEEKGLSICVKGKHFDGSDIEEGTIRSWNKQEYLADTKKKTVKNDCINAVIYSAARASSKEEFIELMETCGFEVKWEDNRKYIAFTHIETQKTFRDNNLSKTYTIPISKETLEYAFNRNKTIQRERDNIAGEGDRNSGVLEESLLRELRKYSDPDTDHRKPVEKNNTVGGRTGNCSFREWPVEGLDRRLNDTKNESRGIIDWSKRISEAFNRCLERIRSFRPGNREDLDQRKWDAEQLAERLEELRSRIVHHEFQLQTFLLPILKTRPDFEDMADREYREMLDVLVDYRNYIQKTDPLTLILAQSMRLKIRTEQEARSLEILIEQEGYDSEGLSPKEVTKVFKELLPKADQKLSDVDKTIDELCAERHYEKPVPYNLIRHKGLRH